MSKRNRKNGKRNVDKLLRFFDVFREELSDVYGRTEPIRFAIDRQLQRMRKRARVDTPKLRGKALSAFLESNRLCRDVPITLDPQIVRDARHFIAVVLERYTLSLDPEAVQTPLELSYLFDVWRFGPGTANGVPVTHAAEKMSEVMTCTAPCEPLVRKLRSSHPYLSAEDAKTGVGVRVVGGSRLGFVLKNEEQLRTIAMEPSGNMCVQLAAGVYIQGALTFIGLDITAQQPKNMALACRGSISGEEATLDLKSASDMNRTSLVKLLWPREWYHLLLRIRSQSVMVEHEDGSREEVPLEMIGTMGNGFTFPLMTLTLTALIYAYRAQRGGPTLRIDWTRTAVYGDDIIVPTDEYEVCVETLEAAGFIVNRDKSYCTGKFRESCGGDYYDGVNVTPVYVKSLVNDSEVYVALNQVLEWSSRYNLVMARTLRYLRGCLVGEPHFVPEWHNPDEGILVPNGPRRYKYLSRKNEEYGLRDNRFAMSLAIGGYISETAPGLFNGKPCASLRGGRPKAQWKRAQVYTPREGGVTFRVREDRIPAGFLDGWDPLTRSYASSQHVGLMAAIVLM